MATLSLREAAEQTGVAKSTIFRAIKAGRLSAPRTDDGNFAIDPAELFRVYPPKGVGETASSPERNEAGRPLDRAERQDATIADGADATELRIRNAQLETEINALRTILAMEKERAGELRAERDRWAGMAEAGQRQLTHVTAATPKAGGGWWPFRRTG